MSLFGSTQNKPNLFPSTTNPGASSAFGQFGNNQQAQQPQPSNSSLFGNSSTMAKPSLFGNSQPQQNQSSSLFAANQQAQPQQGFIGLDQSQQQQVLERSFGGSRSMWQPTSSIAPREKSIPDQIKTLYEKWAPESSNCVFQKYFYNNVGAERVPYFGPEPGEDEQKWEEALSKKPNADAIPVLCKGFLQLGERLRVQVQAMQALQARLHEIDGSLTAQQQSHELDISVRTADAKRKHVALSHRCMRLATKVQVLRNRGYAMDGAEEQLRTKLSTLERSTFDPSLSGRQEEIWARMVNIREQTRMLREEAERITTGSADDQDKSSFDEEVLKKVNKILRDYESQISHLSQQISETRKDYDDWESNGTSPQYLGR